MTKVAPFHSKRVGETRHHDNNKCTEGNNIESYNRASGTGGKPLCAHCQKLDEEGK
jgi:phenylacetate-coenzyme A ligase PaaK-like adenylate-forming protein